jgi:hypothetical protein
MNWRGRDRRERNLERELGSPFWSHLTEAVRTGKPQNEARTGDTPSFEALYADPARLREFLAAMTGISHGAARAIAAKFPWSQYRSYMDVGAAQGDTAAQIALAHPHLSGTGFDLPEVGPIFEDYIEGLGLSSRVRFSPGSFFDSPLPNADVIVMGHILHDWDLDTKRMLVRKAYDALPCGGAYIVYEAIIDDDRSANAFGLMMSLNMLVETPGGFDYTGADCQAGCAKSASAKPASNTSSAPNSMVVGIK